MKDIFNFRKVDFAVVLSIAIVFLIYWTMLLIRLPLDFTRFFQDYSLVLFIFVLIAYYVTYKLPGRIGIVAGLGFTLSNSRKVL